MPRSQSTAARTSARRTAAKLRTDANLAKMWSESKVVKKRVVVRGKNAKGSVVTKYDGVAEVRVFPVGFSYKRAL